MKFPRISLDHSGPPKKQLKPIPRFFAWMALIAVTTFVIFSSVLFPGNSKLYDAIEQGNEAEARRLLEAGADPNSRSRGLTKSRTGRYQSRPLIYALWWNQPGIACALLEAGADPNARTPQGNTALIEAANSGLTEVVRALIEKGADVRAASASDGETPLRHGTSGPAGSKGLDPEIEAMLRRAGAR
jgi:hypothetical protein